MGSASGVPKIRPKELWITYPIIQFCTLKPSAPASHQHSTIRLRCRDFTFVCFCFTDEKKARDVYESIKAWTCKIGRVEKLYAFSYQPQKPEKDVDGWDLYDAQREWKRQGVGESGTVRGWRISHINTDYGVCCRAIKHMRLVTELLLVLSYVSGTAPGTSYYVRQHHQLRWQISFPSSDPCLDLPTSCQ